MRIFYQNVTITGCSLAIAIILNFLKVNMGHPVYSFKTAGGSKVVVLGWLRVVNWRRVARFGYLFLVVISSNKESFVYKFNAADLI